MATWASGIMEMPRSGIREIMDAAWRAEGRVLGLHVGEPTFPPPEHVVEAACKAFRDGKTHYAPNAGLPELRNALSQKLLTHNKFEAGPEQVVVSAGGVQAIYLALSLMVSPGDEVLIPDPGWPNFAMMVNLLHATPVRYPLRAENGFIPDVGELEALATSKTRLILINTPSNPLGTVMSKGVVEGLVRFADRHDIWLLSDECYDGLTFDREHVSPARFDEQGRVLSAFSFSKTYAMTGLRVGYLVTPSSASSAAAKLQEPLISCVNTPAQLGALAALQGPQDDACAMLDAYRSNRETGMSSLESLGIPYLTPHGAFYLWADLRDIVDSPIADWTLRFLREKNVAVAPGTAFGAKGEGWVRLSLATSLDDLKDGIRRLGDMANEQH